MIGFSFVRVGSAVTAIMPVADAPLRLAITFDQTLADAVEPKASV